MTMQNFFQTAGVMAALVFSAYQVVLLRKDGNRREVQRREATALELHRDITMDGDAAAGCRRLSLALRSRGMATFGAETWTVLSEDDFKPGGLLDHATEAHERNYADVYRIMWFFERAYTIERSDLVDSDLLFSLIGFHIWWWNQLLRDIRHPVVMHKVLRLGQRAEDWARRSGRLDDWVRRCATDFDNTGSVDLITGKIHAT